MRAGPEPVPADGRRAGCCARRSRARSSALYGRRYDPGDEITITAGATQAILTAILAVVHPGDEVIVLEPCYDSYVPNIELAGGRVVRVPLTPGTFRPDFAAIAAAHHAAHARDPRQHAAQPERHRVDARRSRAAGRAAAPDRRAADRRRGLRAHGVRRRARTPARRAIPELAARAFVVSSFGKTYHVTGWKVGYVAAPRALTAEFRKVHQFNVFTVNTPVQHGLARYMADPRPYLELPRVLPAQARPVPRRPRAHAAAAAAQRRQLLPVRRLLGDQRSQRRRLLPLADQRHRRGGDPVVGLLRRRPQPAAGALLLRQARRDAEQRPRSTRPAVGAPARACIKTSAWAAAGRRSRCADPGCVVARRNTCVSSSIGSGLVRSTSIVP